MNPGEYPNLMTWFIHLTKILPLSWIPVDSMSIQISQYDILWSKNMLNSYSYITVAQNKHWDCLLNTKKHKSLFSSGKPRGLTGRPLSPPPLIPPNPFLGHPPLLSLIADRTHDFWYNFEKNLQVSATLTTSHYSRLKSFANSSSLVAPHSPNAPRLFPPPPPLFPLASVAAAVSSAASAAHENTPLTLNLTPNWETLQVTRLDLFFIRIRNGLTFQFLVKETAARLLFMAVRWVKCLVPFQTLTPRDQVSQA